MVLGVGGAGVGGAGVAARMVAAGVSVHPNGQLPGTAQLTSLVGGLQTWVLLACVVAVLVGAGMWALGGRAGHGGMAGQGRVMVLGGAVGALLTGAAAALVNFGFSVGGTVR